MGIRFGISEAYVAVGAPGLFEGALNKTVSKKQRQDKEIKKCK